MAAQLFRQALEIGRDFFADHAGHQPLEARGVELIQQRERYADRHAIERMRRLEAVGKLEIHIAHRHAARKLRFADIRGGVAHQVFARHVEQLRLRRFGLLAPRFEGGGVVHARRDQRVVKREQRLFVHQHVGAARLVFEFADLGDQALVVGEKRPFSFDLAGGKPLTDEHLARFGRIERPVVHAPARHQCESVERDALPRIDHAALGLPMRIEVMALDQMTGHTLDPFRLDLRHAARIQPRGLGEFGRHHPLRGCLLETRAGKNRALHTAPAEIGVALLGLETKIAQQAGEQRAMNLFVGRRRFVAGDAEFGHQRVQLAVHVAPFAHAARRKKIILQVLGELAVRFLVLQRLFEPCPQFDEGEKIRALVVEFRVRLISRGGALIGAGARILDFERGGDDEDFTHALMFLRGDDHARDSRIDRKLGEPPADVGQFVAFINGAEFGQQLIAVGDHARARRFEEREILDVADLQRLHAQDGGRQRATQDFRLGELGARLVIVLAIEPDAHAGRHATATAGALIGGGARDVLDLQLLNLVAIAVTVDAREAGVDDVTDARHRQ